MPLTERESFRAALTRTVVLREAHVVREVSRRLRTGEPVVQCAWCHRASDGDGHWERLPRLAIPPKHITGTICSDCSRPLSR